MDTLRINMYVNDTTAMNIDNINVGLVPEPASLSLLAAALMPALLRRRGRRAAR
jgi:hypothetical protein